MSKLTNEELAAKAKEVFESNPKLQSAFQTTDGQCFDREDNAINHQLTLTHDGTEVREVSRNETGAAEVAEEAVELDESEENVIKLQELCMDKDLPIADWEGVKTVKELSAYLKSKGIEVK